MSGAPAGSPPGTAEAVAHSCPECPKGDNGTHHLVPSQHKESVMRCAYCGQTDAALRAHRGVVIRTQSELWEALTERFGPDPQAFAFRCPSCGDVARSRDFAEAFKAAGHEGYGSDRLGQDCIGRWVSGRGCDWAAYGLFQGPEFVILASGKQVPSFPIASAEEAARADR
ncbi:hypothetical protein SEA_NICOLE72_74 [Microbacterium phage Nicole72]|uniref:Uncharacterized protein n=1 Tax=Microbacterium phage Nicole72 TaxID=3062838 RepID=A0ACD4UHL0_9CAUD|nr:hypothetical protein SEA_NICOLE72_74 [Microbacterium phage Nicole72]